MTHVTHYTRKQKQKAIARLGWPPHASVAQVHRITGIPLSTLYAWRRAQAREAVRVHMDETELTRLLGSVAPFSGVPNAMLARLARESRTRAYRAGEVIVAQGTRAHTVCFVLRGSVKQTYISAEGLAQVMRLAGPGDPLNDVSAWRNEPALYGSVAIAPSVILHAPVGALRTLLGGADPFARGLIEALYLRLHRSMHDSAALATHSGMQRIAGFLLREADRRATDELELHLDRKLVASRLGVTPEYFSRILHQLADTGCIAVSPHRITLRNHACLRNIVRHGTMVRSRRCPRG